MGRLKTFLIQEQMRISGNWREKDSLEYLAWRKSIEEKEQIYYEGKGKVSRGSKQRGGKKTMG
tara:strand:- start:9671 stop:9859 length:189 start_codon:yes stop_codon:yes gene_type:complete